MMMIPRGLCSGLIAGVILLGGCGHVTNVNMCGDGSNGGAAGCEYKYEADKTYRFSPKAGSDTLVIVTLSGGGIRAAALSFGTLQALGLIEGPNGNTLLDQVDMISSVSGGSVTAAWYALHGRAGLAHEGENGKLWQFLHHNWNYDLAWKATNPVTLARYAFSPYGRGDVLADFFSANLFADATYADVFKLYKTGTAQPYVMLNATDLGHQSIFPFTQGRFDLLCSDLLQYRVADAVAASANYPLVFSSTNLQNYSGCAAQQSDSWNNHGPPKWLAYYSKYDSETTQARQSYGLSQLRAARQAQDYLRSPALGDQDKFVHLLDGGVGDNLGVRSTLAIEDDPARVPGLYVRLSTNDRPSGYENIRRILYVVVNARTRDPAGIDRSEGAPGEIETAFRMVDTLLDNSTLADQDFLIAELEATANQGTNGTSSVPDVKPFLSFKSEAQARAKATQRNLEFYVVSVDFEMIPDKKCRDHYWSLGTNWGLDTKDIDGLVDISKVILSRSTDLKNFYKSYESAGVQPPSLLKSPLSFKDVCPAQ
jgi:NTE family protein